VTSGVDGFVKAYATEKFLAEAKALQSA